ncbi:DNA-binding helix-turn-helix protein [Marvinbryantia formatexigens DSM 14469]|uniref:DNA-binding helix-turn-helix protein n=1 Tax=Marvinbryantia formatexigens DSM 14469 TaxID=478749 RepID=C6LFB8_9FIRM|nr:helix-turn-helix transcriptional regulator [Marvinbryantia formatexigens]EET60857.1 DNA-binding helix-turn-helix protein [Marvinbryantia formatexigens DSM 14469]UWO26818.1 helix-turn-helix domain-containing protein [Marvinbryantia formatexigens DSM 14469]SDH20813.1 Helix-turn-helix [Marvinbryantia formatexigens]
MIRAYDELYLESARRVLAGMLDYAVHDLGYDITSFFNLFLKSPMARWFENGDSAVLAGKSGVELAYDVLGTIGENRVFEKPQYTMNRSEEYWTGWSLAYYQWYTALSFSEITRYIPIKEIQELYFPYHEMDIRQFVDKMNELYRKAKPDTNLKLLRKRAGLTQRELAEYAGIPLRTIQQYEQRQKNINRAQAEYLVKLAKVLCCSVENLIEYVPE